MATATGISLSEYLATDYKPDREYLDGEVVERNVGQGPHSYTQTALGAWLFGQQKRWNMLTLTEQRVQVSGTHYRIPDLCVVRKDDFANIIQRPPLLCVEILSPEDRWNQVQDSIADYLRFGVPEIWVPFSYESTGADTRFTNWLDPDPRSRQVFTFHRPETLAAWLDEWQRSPDSPTLRSRLRKMPPLEMGLLWPPKDVAITNLEESDRKSTRL